MKVTQKAIESFFASKKIAIAGVSRDSKKFGYSVFTTLSERGYDIYPINPNTQSLWGTPCFATVLDLPPDVKNLVVLTPKNETEKVVRDAVKKGISSIWIQQMSDTPEAIKLAESNNIQLISKECILMWANPVTSIHKFHKTIKKIFGLLPKYE
jgi:predicted CoA-binding protein